MGPQELHIKRRGLKIGDRGYAIVEVDIPESRQTYPHEIGHTLGARHDNEGAVPNDAFSVNIEDYARGRRFSDAGGQERWTIMSVFPPNNTRIPHFSNPAINFNGTATGTADRDNARQIEENGACLVAGYRDYTAPVEVIITGYTNLEAGSSSTWCTTIANCDNITDYDWEYSYDGFSYTGFFGSSCASRTAPSSGTSTMWLRVTVTCDNGTTDTDVHRVTIGQGGDGPIPIIMPNQDNVTKFDGVNYTNDVLIYPNPLVGDRTINYQLPGEVQFDAAVEAALFSMEGRKIQVFTLATGSRIGQLAIRPELPAGMYVLRFTIGTASFRTKVSVR